VGDLQLWVQDEQVSNGTAGGTTASPTVIEVATIDSVAAGREPVYRRVVRQRSRWVSLRT
jgi:hypothetical protein